MPHRKPPDFDKAVEILLSPANISYLKHLAKQVSDDPQFLYRHEISVGLEIQRRLFNGGIGWEPKLIMRNWSRVLRVALDGL